MSQFWQKWNLFIEHVLFSLEILQILFQEVFLREWSFVFNFYEVCYGQYGHDQKYETLFGQTVDTGIKC